MNESRTIPEESAHGSDSAAPARRGGELRVLAVALLVQVLGFVAGVLLAPVLCPPVGGLADAFQPMFAVVLGFAGLCIASLWSVWLCCRRL